VANTLTATTSVRINARPAAVWALLTDSEAVGQAFFGAKVTTDWQEGSPITFSGEWEGTTYEDKGEIRRVVPDELLETTHWSPLSGAADEPENYSPVRYRLTPTDGGTELSVTQGNVADEQSREHYEAHWAKMLDGLKRMAER
jgi:uncharacterized protein YndB with AHSA1/START domain